MDVIATRKEKVIYRDGDVVIKEFSEKFPKSDILNEALNQARVEETGLPIPALRAVSVIDGKWAITMDYVEGKTLEQIMEEDPDAKVIMCTAIGQQQTVMEALGLGASDYVIKPFQKDKLVEAVLSVLGIN